VAKRAAREAFLTSGVDIGAHVVKIAVLSHQGGRTDALAKVVTRIGGRRDAGDARSAIREAWVRVLAEAGLSAQDVQLVASTGAPERQLVRVGHFYRRSSRCMIDARSNALLLSSADPIFAGALGAALLAAGRYRQARPERTPPKAPEAPPGRWFLN
jgi:activator of 2-hydroxyglutaryl-CoA dehydratase